MVNETFQKFISLIPFNNDLKIGPLTTNTVAHAASQLLLCLPHQNQTFVGHYKTTLCDYSWDVI